jgi:predicted amidohydrolase YtcJ
MNKKAFINGKIYTVNPQNPQAESVVVHDKRIIFAGSGHNAKRLIDKETEVIDLRKRLMLPGFIDSHTHFIRGGFHLQSINLHNANSEEEFRFLIKKHLKENPDKWITGGYWDNERWGKNTLPTKELIDNITTNIPVFVERFDEHTGLANSLALKLAGITKNTESPEGGLIEKDNRTGEPTGILKDNAMTLIYKIIPPHSDEEIYKASLTALDEAAKNGITSIHDITYPRDLSAFQNLERDNKLTIRIYTRLPISTYHNLIDEGIAYNFGSYKLKIGSLKAFADGSLGSGTAWFFEPYLLEPDNYGLSTDIVQNGSLERWGLEADKNNLQLSVHAIGDKANWYVLDIFERIAKTNAKWDRRFRIEHAQHLRSEDIPKFKEHNVIASCQPYHAIDDGVWAEKKIGHNRIKTTYTFKSLLDTGAKVCFGSDWPVAPLNALYGIYAATTRITLDGKNLDGWIPEQKISIEQAIKCYTIDAAYAGYQENQIGSIEPGKFADLIILDHDILSIAPEEIKDVQVDTTIFDGQIIYDSKG